MAKLRRRLDRFGLRLVGPRHGTDSPPRPHPASGPSWVLAGAKGRGECRSVLAVVLGLEPPEVATLVARLAGTNAPPGVVPVFVTDRSDFEPYRARRACFEYLPPPARKLRSATERDWELYRLRRFCILASKWQPVQIVAFGGIAAGWLASVRDSAHVPDGMRSLILVAPPDAQGILGRPSGRPRGTP
jgi:hypothetical protein